MYPSNGGIRGEIDRHLGGRRHRAYGGLVPFPELSRQGRRARKRRGAVGGLAATFTRNGLSFDLGSHRLHEGYHPEVDALVKDLCGDDLLRRERRGLIYLGGRALRYPPSPFDIIFAFGFCDSLRFIRDFLLARFSRLVSPREHEDFEGFTIGMVGRSLYERFYRPYALKLYGMSPRDISKDPAVSRVRKFSFRSFYSDFRKKLHKKSRRICIPSEASGSFLPRPRAAIS